MRLLGDANLTEADVIFHIFGTFLKISLNEENLFVFFLTIECL